MSKFLIELRDVVGICCKTNIAFIKEPDGQRIEVADQNPLPNIKLQTLYNQWPFNILLHDPLHLAIHHVLDNRGEVRKTADPSSSRQTSRLDYPYVMGVG